jgi:hypothetical protein
MSQSVSPTQLRLPSSEERTRYSRSEVRKFAAKIRENGFPGSVIIDDQGYVVAGWELVQAAIHLGCEVPIRKLSEGQGRAEPHPSRLVKSARRR